MEAIAEVALKMLKASTSMCSSSSALLHIAARRIELEPAPFQHGLAAGIRGTPVA
jgi:hypothetical protein